MHKLAVNAAMAGDDWFYRFPVKKPRRRRPSTSKARRSSWRTTSPACSAIAPSRCARSMSATPGRSMRASPTSRPASQWSARSASAKVADLDADQRLRSAAGHRLFDRPDRKRSATSSSIRCRYFADFAFREARNSLVDKIGKDVDTWRQRTVDGIAQNAASSSPASSASSAARRRIGSRRTSPRSSP